MRKPRFQTFGVPAGLFLAALLLVVLVVPIATPRHRPAGTTREVAASPLPRAVASPASAAASPVAPTMPPATSPPPIGVEIGQPAPDFELPGIDGAKVRLSTLRGHVVWINFWAPWCPACRSEMPRLEHFWLERQEQGLIVLGVGVKDTPEAFRAYAEEVGVTYPLVMDLYGTVAASYKALVLPVHFWIDRDGIVRDWAFGELPPDILASILDGVLPPTEPTP